MSETGRAVPRRIAQAILNSLQSGVVPRPAVHCGREEGGDCGAASRHGTHCGGRRFLSFFNRKIRRGQELSLADHAELCL